MKKYLIISSVICLIIAFVSVRYALRQRKDANISKNNLYASELNFKTESGKIASNVSELQLSHKDLKNAAKKDSLLRNEFEQKLANAYTVISDLNLKIKNVESSNSIVIETGGYDSIIYRIDSTRLISMTDIHTPFFDAIFKPVGDSIIIVSHSYHSAIDIIISRQKALKLDGKKRFILSRLLFPKWNYSSAVVSKDPNAIIKSNVLLRLKNR